MPVIQPLLKFNASRKARPLSVPGVGDFKGEGERLASSAPSPLRENAATPQILEANST